MKITHGGAVQKWEVKPWRHDGLGSAVFQCSWYCHTELDFQLSYSPEFDLEKKLDVLRHINNMSYVTVLRSAEQKRLLPNGLRNTHAHACTHAHTRKHACTRARAHRHTGLYLYYLEHFKACVCVCVCVMMSLLDIYLMMHLTCLHVFRPAPRAQCLIWASSWRTSPCWTQPSRTTLKSDR